MDFIVSANDLIPMHAHIADTAQEDNAKLTNRCACKSKVLDSAPTGT